MHNQTGNYDNVKKHNLMGNYDNVKTQHNTQSDGKLFYTSN